MDKPIGELLGQWNLYLTNISRNLMELSEQTKIKIIMSKAKDPINGYTGITKVKAVECVQCFESLWQYYSLLIDNFERANELNNQDSFLNNTEDEVKEILQSAPIIIETQHIAINDRNLLSDELYKKSMTPQELLRFMQESFENLCRVTLEIADASDKVEGRINNMKTDIIELNSAIRRIGISNINEFDVSEVTKFESDPLKGLLELDRIVYGIEKFRASIKDAEKDYLNIIESFNTIRAIISELYELALKSETATKETQYIFHITENFKPIVSKDVLKSLEDWLEVLENKLNIGYLNAVKVGVSNLQQECLIKLEIERENYYINSKYYNEWLDLKGEFKALVAKSKVLEAKELLINNSLNEVIETTNNALYAKPVDLDSCRKLVNGFKEILNNIQTCK